jgi:CRISPR type I-D-associated protein Csc2
MTTQFVEQLADIATLVPRDHKGGKKIAQAIYTRQIVTIVGVKTTSGRFLPVSHQGYSNETYVDKVDLLGKTRAEFIGRKMKGIERRAHMALFREELKANQNQDWQTFFVDKFGKACTIPDGLCVACWNCSLFGGMEPGKGATFSRIRYFDSFSVEDAAECVQSDDSPEQMAIGNTVGEDLSVERGEASFYRYEYVKAGVRFPFITIIESPTLLDVAGYLAAVKLADQHGYGKYSANHGKFETEFLAISTGYPLFSVLNMLSWLETSALANPHDKLRFETAVGEPVTLFGAAIDSVREAMGEQFTTYLAALNAAPAQVDGEKPKGRREKAK